MLAPATSDGMTPPEVNSLPVSQHVLSAQTISSAHDLMLETHSN